MTREHNRSSPQLDAWRGDFGDAYVGRNELGERVASGVYFYELEAGGFREMRRLMVVK